MHSRYAQCIAGGLSITVLLVLGFWMVRENAGTAPDSGVNSDLIPVKRVEPVTGLSRQPVSSSLESVLSQSKWTVLLFFRTTDCYSCVTYASRLKEELKTFGDDRLQIAAIAINTNAGEVQAFLRSVEIPFPVFVAPPQVEAQRFYENINGISPTPFFALAKESDVQYATRLVPSRELMEDKYDTVFDYVSNSQ